MLVMLSALLALVPATGLSAHSAREHPAACAVLEIGSDQAPHAYRLFRATRILELEFEAQVLHPGKHDHALQLRLYTPDGFLYQVLETRVGAAGASRRRYRARLPVAGTSIMASGLYGRWRVVPHADGAREPCGRGRSFVIRP